MPEDLTISRVWNLQTFIFHQCTPARRYSNVLPNGIWKMSQLRHLHSKRISLHPSTMLLENLTSVSGLSPVSCMEKEIIKKVTKLGIYCYDREVLFLNPLNLNLLHELETLNIEAHHGYYHEFPVSLPCPDSFPPNLKKLTVQGTLLAWKNMTIISKLPKLEVLQLKCDAFGCLVVEGIHDVYPVDRERVREVTEMGFPELKFLLLEELQLRYWSATHEYFPCLVHIVIKKCPELKTIPEGFEKSTTLQGIELWGCSPCLVTFAKQIQENHEELGTTRLKFMPWTLLESDSDKEYGEAEEEVMKRSILLDRKGVLVYLKLERDCKGI